MSKLYIDDAGSIRRLCLFLYTDPHDMEQGQLECQGELVCTSERTRRNDYVHACTHCERHEIFGSIYPRDKL